MQSTSFSPEKLEGFPLTPTPLSYGLHILYMMRDNSFLPVFSVAAILAHCLLVRLSSPWVKHGPLVFPPGGREESRGHVKRDQTGLV